MKVGIDIDNVISNFDEVLLKEFLLHDKNLRNNGVVNKEKYIVDGMFDWSKLETESFYNNNIERIAKSLEVIKDAKLYIDKLIQDGHEIYIISGRDNGEYSDPYNMTIKWLKANKIFYHKIILTNAYNHDKYIVCLENNIDIMIDDSKIICEKCKDNHINVLLMDTPYNKESDLKRVYNWKEIYEYIAKL